ncbi:hypothetical protein BCR44DRAFT_1460279 [Catenaria anguillulae PL171]|uniref:PH domain-containing protein n=1 Tax=Catenaria anguillulae PL171 TaxID=765915 RepID=A0A1Y2HRV4_9FUNG|nr:hypothetical protein BCR44DRAFT_1460279 [Catenaria anguillulae PL171]
MMDNSDVSSAIKTVLAAESSYIDVILMDVVWIGNYGEYLLPLDGNPGLSAALAQHNPDNIAAGVIDGKLIAIPQRADYGVLFSRRDMLNRYNYTTPPTTWDEMEEMIAKILPEERKIKPGLIGMTNQVNPEEGFTCNILEWLGEDDAGTILEADRTLSSFDQSSPKGRKVIKVAERFRRWNQNGWIQTGFTSAAGTTQWTRGNTIFLRQWPNVASSSVSFPWVLSMLPGKAATLGGWLWGVSKFSKQPEAAKRVLEFFASPAWQKVRAIKEGNVPTVSALFNDSDVCAVLPICGLASQFKVIRRPSGAAGAQYPLVSGSIYNHFFDIVRGYGGSISYMIDSLNRDIARILNIDVLGAPTNAPTSSVPVVAFGIVAIIMALALMASLALFAVTRTTSVVGNLGLPSFLAPSTIGLIMQLTLIITTAGVPNSATCYARYWIHGIGYTLAIMSIAMRNHHIWSTSLNPFLKKRNPSSQVVLTTVVAPLVVTFAILIGFTASGAIDANDIKLSKSRYYECKSLDPNIDSVAHIVWYIWLGLQMLTALWTGLKASKLATAPQEPKAMMICLANAAMLAIVILPFIDLGLVDQSTSYILRSILIEVPIATFILVFLAPRLLLAWQHWRHPEMEKVLSQASSMLKTSTVGLKTSNPGDASMQTSIGAPKVAMGAGAATVMAGAPKPALNVTELAQVGSFRDRHAIGYEGVVSERQVNKKQSRLASLFAFMRPWTLKRLYLLKQTGLLALHDLSSQTELGRAKCIPTRAVTSVVMTDAPNVFALTRQDGTVSEIMVSSPEEAKQWVNAIASALFSNQR